MATPAYYGYERDSSLCEEYGSLWQAVDNARAEETPRFSVDILREELLELGSARLRAERNLWMHKAVCPVCQQVPVHPSTSREVLEDLAWGTKQGWW